MKTVQTEPTRETKKDNCDCCGKPIRKRYWMNPFGSTYQCDRWWCRLLFGHYLWMKFHIHTEVRYIVIGKEYCKAMGGIVTKPIIKIPYLVFEKANLRLEFLKVLDKCAEMIYGDSPYWNRYYYN